MMIDFLKIANALNIIPIASIAGFLFLILLWQIISVTDFFPKNKIICAFSLFIYGKFWDSKRKSNFKKI